LITSFVDYVLLKNSSDLNGILFYQQSKLGKTQIYVQYK